MGNENWGIEIYSIEGEVSGICCPLGMESEELIIVKVGKVKYSIPSRKVKHLPTLLNAEPLKSLIGKKIIFERGEMSIKK
jgi:hypothetical protein